MELELSGETNQAVEGSGEGHEQEESKPLMMYRFLAN